MDYGAKTGTSRFVRAMKIIGDYKFPEEPATLSVSPMQVELTSEEGATADVTVSTNNRRLHTSLKVTAIHGFLQNRMEIKLIYSFV